MSSRPIRLDKAFTQGVLRYIIIPSGTVVSPPKNHVWLVFNGFVNHVTLTDTVIDLSVKRTTAIAAYRWISKILSATASGYYPLFNTAANEGQSQYGFIIASNNDEFSVTGDAGSDVRLSVLEWEQ